MIFPPRLAAITPCLITQNRSTVTPISRTPITAVTHQDSSPSADSVISADPVRALSAIGSAILPKSVIIPLRRASCPSRRSVTEAMPKTANAAIRVVVPFATRNTTKTGTSASRSIVSPFARLTSLGAAGALLASELVNGPGQPGTSVFSFIDRTRHQVHPL